jgi:nucleoside-diphosphate-sugar epimerase
MNLRSEFDPVLVTGGAGFVGACAVRALLERGHTVHVLLRPQSRPWRLADVLPRLTVHRADLTDAGQTRAAVLSARPRAVLHLAAHGAYECQADARAILRTNILGTYNLLEAASEAEVAVFINTGSSSEYGFRSEPMCETDRLEPNSFYAVAKAAQTHLCALLGKKGAMGVVVFRLFSVYGPWEEPSRLIPTLIRRARAGLPLEMVAPDIARDFVYVEDVVDALLDLPAAARLRGEAINLGTGIETNLREVVEAVTDLLGNRSEVRWGSMKPRHWDNTRWSADPAKAVQLLGWRPRHTLRQGLAKMAEWMQSMGDDYGTDPNQRLRAAG